MGWDGMGWDGMGWDGMGWDGMGWGGVGLCGFFLNRCEKNFILVVTSCRLLNGLKPDNVTVHNEQRNGPTN